MEINQKTKQVGSVNVFGLLAPFTRRIMSIYTSGRSPGFWLLRAHLAFPFFRTVAYTVDETLASYSSATASALHRLPYSAEIVGFSHLMKNNFIVVPGNSIPQIIRAY